MKRDEAAIRRCRTGQGDAFQLLVERYQSEALAHALAILRHREDALDAVQDFEWLPELCEKADRATIGKVRATLQRFRDAMPDEKTILDSGDAKLRDEYYQLQSACKKLDELSRRKPAAKSPDQPGG